MGTYIVTDLTRLETSKVCVGVIDVATGQCLRPWYPEKLTCKWVTEQDVQPGVKLDGQIFVSPKAKRPHIEDSNHLNLINLGSVTKDEFRETLEKSVSGSISAGLDVDIPEGKRCIQVSENPECSLITIKVSPESLSIEYDHEKNKLRASFLDGSGQSYKCLPVGDICFNRAFSLCGNLSLEELKQFFSKQ